jgi:PST family polysaccharide transporter
MALVTVILAPILVWFYGRTELLGITIALSSGFLISGVAAQHKALLRRTLQFGQIARIDIATAVIGMAAGLLAAWSGFGYWSIVIQQLGRTVVATVGLWIASNWRPSSFRWDPSVKPMLRFGGFLAVNSVMNYASRNVDNVAIGWMWGAGPLGIYTRAYSLLTMPLSQITAPLGNVAIPAFSRLREEQDRFRSNFLALMSTTAFFMVPAVAVMMACADSIVLLLLGQKWAEVAQIYRWLGFAALTQPMTAICGILFLSQGRSQELSRSTLITSFFAVLSIFAALPWGPAAVAASYSISGLIIRTPIQFHFAGKVSSVTLTDLYSVFVPQVLLGGAIFAGGYFAGHFVGPTNLWAKIAAASAVGVVFVGFGLLFSARQRSALGLVQQLFKSKTKKLRITYPVLSKS